MNRQTLPTDWIFCQIIKEYILNVYYYKWQKDIQQSDVNESSNVSSKMNFLPNNILKVFTTSDSKIFVEISSRLAERNHTYVSLRVKNDMVSTQMRNWIIRKLLRKWFKKQPVYRPDSESRSMCVYMYIQDILWQQAIVILGVTKFGYE